MLFRRPISNRFSISCGRSKINQRDLAERGEAFAFVIMRLLSNCFAIALMFAPAVPAATDPFAGTWTLNLQRSKYPPGTLPKRMVIQMEAVGDSIRYCSETIDAGGRTSTAEYIAG